jgi:hypothetical protein
VLRFDAWRHGDPAALCTLGELAARGVVAPERTRDDLAIHG